MSDRAIDVIVRTGGRPAASLVRAVRSLARQSAGAIRLLLVRHGAADAAALQTLVGGALHSIEVIDAPGANRGRAMAAGLARVTAPRFAFLDDDDYLLEDHFLHLLHAAESVAAPAFAYCDILVQDEGTPRGADLSPFRKGPAQPPLGRITDRISVHAFLAARAALEGLRFSRWGQATAEDALLVASLLARSTPVHTPHATCVYVQGRGDASAYLSHPDRAADELTFAREIAPFRAIIEARFGIAEEMDETTYLAPFIAAARHAALFAELKTRPSDSGLAAVRDAVLVTPVATDPALASIGAPLAFEAAAGSARSMQQDGGVEIGAGEDYAYAARLPLDLPTEARPLTVAVRVSGADGAFGLALVDAGHSLLAEARVDPVSIPLEIQLSWDRREPPTLIVRRLNALGAEPSRVRIDGIALAVPCRGPRPRRKQGRGAVCADRDGSRPRELSSRLPSPRRRMAKASEPSTRQSRLSWARRRGLMRSPRHCHQETGVHPCGSIWARPPLQPSSCGSTSRGPPWANALKRLPEIGRPPYGWNPWPKAPPLASSSRPARHQRGGG